MGGVGGLEDTLGGNYILDTRVLIICSTVCTTLWRTLQLMAWRFPYQTVMQLARMLLHVLRLKMRRPGVNKKLNGMVKRQ